jgi:tetratricopeptide (TPR) repeat protein
VAKLNPVKVKQDADKLEKAGKFEQAIDLYRQLVDDNPRDWNTVKKIGDLYARLNRNREAIEQYSRVADFYAKDGFLLKAIAIWKQINKLDPSALDPYAHLADLYAKQGLMMEAKGQYQIVVDEYIKRGKMRDAGDILKKMAEIDPGDLKVRSKLADLYTRDGNTARAVDEHVAIADELTKKGHLAEALQVLEKGLKIDPKSARLASELARIHLVQKNWEKAAHYLEDAARQQPQDVQVLARLGEAYLGAKRVEEAEAIFKRLLELDPADIEARVQMARVFLLQREHDRAFEELQQAVDALLERREGERAATLLQQLLQAEPHHVPSLLKLVEVYRQLRKDAFVAQTYSHLTEAYINQGRMDRAAEILETLIGLEPQNQQHKTKLQFVKSRLQGGAAGAQPRAAGAPPRAAAPASPLVELEEEEFDLTAVEEAPPFVPAGEERVSAAPRAAAAAAGPALARPTIEPSGPLTDDDREFIEEHLAEGKVFRKYGLVDKAADQFEAVVARFPDNAEARQELREVLKEKGLPLKAAEQCLALAEIFRLRGDVAAAEAQEAEAELLAPGASAAAAAAPAPAAPAPAKAKLAAPSPPPAATAEAEEEEIALPEGEEEVPLEVEEGGVELQPESDADLDLGLGAEAEGELAPHFVEEEPAASEEALDLSLAEEPAAPSAPPAAAPPATPLAVAEEELDLGLEEKPAAPVAPLRAAPVRPHARAEAPAATSLPGDLQRVLSEVDSYISLGFVEDAKDALREIGVKYPNHPAISEKLAELGLESEQGELAPPPAPPRAVPAAALVEEELDLGGVEEPAASAGPDLAQGLLPDEPAGRSAPPALDAVLDLELPEPSPPLPPPLEPEAEPATAASTTEDAFAALELSAPPGVLGPENGGLDLGSELGELFSAQAAVEEAPAPAASTALGDSGLEEIFKEFRKGVDKQLGQEDYDTRYNLGIAYKEMGLVDEAIAEFQLAAKDDARLLECSSMLGICFMEKGMPKLAVKWFEKGLKAPGRSEEEYQGLRYDLAAALEASGELDRAYQLFSELYGQDANFRDVAAKVRELKAALG